MTPSGIEFATVRLVAQCHNQLRYRVHATVVQSKEDWQGGNHGQKIQVSFDDMQ
jgi:hypothetical protein